MCFEEGSRIYVLQKGNWVFVPPMMAAKGGIDYLPSLGTDRASLKNIVRSEVERGNLTGVFGAEEWKREVVLKLCAQRWL